MNKSVEDILKQYPFIGEDIQKAQKEINRYIDLQQEARNTVKSQALTGMPHGYGVSDQTYDAVCRIVDLYQAQIDKYVAQVEDLINQQKWLDKAFELLTEDERRVLYMKYDRGMGIHKIGYAMRKGTDTVKRLLDEAKDKIKKTVL